jgi:hypothetical protein
MWTLNDQDRSTIWSASYSFDGATWVELVAMGHTTPTLADATPMWSGTDYAAAVSLETAAFAAGDPFYLRWDAIGGDGGGSRDESAIDDISLTFIYEE